MASAKQEPIVKTRVLTLIAIGDGVSFTSVRKLFMIDKITRSLWIGKVQFHNILVLHTIGVCVNYTLCVRTQSKIVVIIFPKSCDYAFLIP